ncbi:MAG TPA: hypothetical protein VFF49_02795 [Thermodesulfobacteriota bacterium]|nr:hypothetical protein [Thermodesulfobacteriota bacterium]
MTLHRKYQRTSVEARRLRRSLGSQIDRSTDEAGNDGGGKDLW